MNTYNNPDEVEQFIKENVEKLQNDLNIIHMPSSQQFRKAKIPTLEMKISQTGGFTYWRKRLGLDKSKVEKSFSLEEIEVHILKCKEVMGLDSMPTRKDIMDYMGDYSLDNRIQRTGGYRFWANKTNLPIKESETQLGQDTELIAKAELESKGYTVESMSTGHPYDLLINDYIKVDVKAGRAYDLKGSRCHTFGINKQHASCDLYMIYALSEEGEQERLFIIPSHKLKVKTLSIGAQSKYDKYLSRWDLFQTYNDFFKTIE